jgi:hypothetical protein
MRRGWSASAAGDALAGNCGAEKEDDHCQTDEFKCEHVVSPFQWLSE